MTRYTLLNFINTSLFIIELWIVIVKTVIQTDGRSFKNLRTYLRWNFPFLHVQSYSEVRPLLSERQTPRTFTMFVWFLVRTWFRSRRRYWFTRTLYNRVRSCLAHVFVNVVYVLLFNIGPAAAAPVVLYVHNSANQPPGEISLSPLIQPRIRIKFPDSQNTSLFRPAIYIRRSAEHIKVWRRVDIADTVLVKITNTR